MGLMPEAGFNRVFIGIETPNEDGLVECNKAQNRNRDLAAGISKLRFSYITGFLKTMWFLGIWNRGRGYYWKLLISTLLKRPRHFPISVSLSVSGFHFRKVAEGYNTTIPGHSGGFC